MTALSSLYSNAVKGKNNSASQSYLDAYNNLATGKTLAADNGVSTALSYSGMQKRNAPSATSMPSTAAVPTYDNNVDYSTLLTEAMNNKKSISEVQDILNKRNSKIMSNDNLGQYANDAINQQAQKYISTRTDYDPNTDYSVLIKEYIKNGASPDEVSKLLEQRTQKSLDNGKYAQYLYDNNYDEGADYVKYQKMIQEQTKRTDEQTKLDEDAIWAAVDKGALTLEQGKQKLEQIYKEAAKQAYVANQVSMKGVNEALSAQGLGKTGYLPKTYGSISDAYGNALSSATSVKNQGSQDIDNSIANIKAGAYTDIAKLKSDNAKTLAEKIYEIQNNQNTQSNWREQFNQNNQQFDKQIDNNKNQANQEYQYQNAWNLLNQGVYSDELAGTLGISKEVAKQYAETAKRLLGS